MSEKLTTTRLDDPIKDDRTDWDRILNMTDEENEANIAGDFDSWPLEDQARGFFFHVRPTGENGGWTWDMVDRESRVVARATYTYASRTEAEASTGPLKSNLKAA